MRMYICTLPRMRTLGKLVCTAFALTFLCMPAGTQDSRSHGNGAQAEFHINVIIAPVVFPPRHKDRDRDHDDARIIFNLSPLAEKYAVTEETRSMLVDSLRHEQVQLTTVVLK